MRYFLDTEFNEFGGELISMALVREDGVSAYWVVGCDNPGNWVAQNVMPILDSAPHVIRVERGQLPHLIADFFGEDKAPLVISDWPDDIRHFCEAVISGPGQIVWKGDLQFYVARVDAYPTSLPGAIQHNAWWDAMALRQLIQG